VAYVAPLVVTHQPPDVLSSAVVLVPVLAGIGCLIARQVAHQRRQREELRRAEQWRAALTLTLAHDVRSPLSALQMALETLQQDGADLPTRTRASVIDMALNQTARMHRLTTGLLDLERVSSEGALKLDLRAVSLREAIDEAVTLVAADAAVELDVAPGLTAWADPQRLDQVLVNLFTNALRHGRPPVVVRAESGGSVTRIEVRDHGQGLPPGDTEALFERFWRAEGGRERGRGGAGLGLAIVAGIVDAHGGRVHAANAPGGGASFVVELPAARSQAALSRL
jgi:signal transduction histidine kinase